MYIYMPMKPAAALLPATGSCFSFHAGITNPAHLVHLSVTWQAVIFSLACQ